MQQINSHWTLARCVVFTVFFYLDSNEKLHRVDEINSDAEVYLKRNLFLETNGFNQG